MKATLDGRPSLNVSSHVPDGGIGDPISEALHRLPGYPYLFPWQRLVVTDILEGAWRQKIPGGGGCDDIETRGFKNRIVILPTGAGKSLCFQLPSLILEKVTLVMYPLLSLMADQQQKLSRAGIRSRILKGGQSEEERESVFESVRNGETRLLLTNPEAVLAGTVPERLKSLGIGHLVVDEAHCVAEWGDSFRPSYLKLGEITRLVDPDTVSAFTATASPQILARMREVLFGGEEANLMAGNPDRPNIEYRVLPSFSKDSTVESLLATMPKPAIVFCRSRKGAELAAMGLRGSLPKDTVFFYHAGLDRDERETVEAWFRDSQDGVLCATCAYGMGVDKADIRTVIHRELPPSVEAYLQESGRAGRDGKRSEAVLLLSWEDTARKPEEEKAGKRYASLLEWAGDVSACRREGLLKRLDSRTDWCPGCDVCDGTAARHDPIQTALESFLEKNQRRYTKRELALLLSGERTIEWVENSLPEAFGKRSWRITTDHAEKAIEGLTRHGLLAETRFPEGNRRVFIKRRG